MNLDQEYKDYQELELRIRQAIEEGLIESKGLNRQSQVNFCSQRVMDVLEGLLKTAQT